MFPPTDCWSQNQLFSRRSEIDGATDCAPGGDALCVGDLRQNSVYSMRLIVSLSEEESVVDMRVNCPANPKAGCSEQQPHAVEEIRLVE